MVERMRRVGAVAFMAVLVAAGIFFADISPAPAPEEPAQEYPEIIESANTDSALAALDDLEVKGRAPRTGYEREQFGAGWAEVDGCDMRNYILARDLNDEVLADDGCIVLSGILHDPYTGETIPFTRGQGTSDDVQIDHVVALSDAWQKGAQGLDEAKRAQFANDPLNLLAVDGPTNQAKSDSDAASWLPPNRDYRCRYVARQIAVKRAYNLWVTAAERDAMARVLGTCPEQVLPVQVIET